MNLYTHQSSNIRKSWIIIVFFMAFVMLIGWLLGNYFNSMWIFYFAIGLSLFQSIFAYYKSDAIAIRSAGAIPADETRYRDLHNIVENLAITAGLPKPRVYIIPDQSPNAFATGRDPEHAAVAVTQGLLQILDKSELEGVIAHELAHIGNRDILVATIVVVLVGVLTAIVDMIWYISFSGNGEERHPAMLIIGIIAIIASPFIGMMIQAAVSRRREFVADATGALLTRYPDGLANALRKISANHRPMKNASSATAHMFISNPFGGGIGSRIKNLFSTHPPVAERVSRLLSQSK